MHMYMIHTCIYIAKKKKVLAEKKIKKQCKIASLFCIGMGLNVQLQKKKQNKWQLNQNQNRKQKDKTRRLLPFPFHPFRFLTPLLLFYFDCDFD